MPKDLNAKLRSELLGAVQARFENNMNRHQGIEWAKVQARLEAHPEKLWSLREMERTGGEPDVIGYDKGTDEYTFYDCAAARSLLIVAITMSSCITTVPRRTMPLEGSVAC